MKKSICVIEGRRIKKYRLGAITLPLTVVRKHLYPTDDKFFHRDQESEEALLLIELEATQPYGDGTMTFKPDDGIAILDTSYSTGKKGVGFISLIFNNPMVLVYGAVAIIVLLTALGVM